MLFINIKKILFLILLSFFSLHANPNASLLDIDQDGKVLQETDATLIMRYLLGFRGDKLIEKALSSSTEQNSSTIEATLSKLLSSKVLDIDGDGEIKAFQDALLLSRWLIGMRGNDLIRGIIRKKSSRKSSKEISNYIKITFAF